MSGLPIQRHKIRIGGGIAAWLLADAAIVNLDELMHRDEFESNLQALIDQDKTYRMQRIEEALRKNAQQMEEFLLKDLAPTRLDN